MRIVVTGGFGDVGSRVVRRLRESGHEVTAASRRTGADLVSGDGLREVLAGVDAVVLAAMHPLKASAVEVDGTRRVLEALDEQWAGSEDAGRAHAVYISIVGCDVPGYPYYAAKLAGERVLEDWGGPATVVRATQFHALAAFMAGLRLGPIGLQVGDMAVQPVDIDFVAQRLAEVASGPAPQGFSRTTELAGPEVLEAPEVADLVAAHNRRRPPRLVRLPAIGAAMRTFGDRHNLPTGPVDIGGVTFADWLAAQPSPLPRGMHHAR